MMKSNVIEDVSLNSPFKIEANQSENQIIDKFYTNENGGKKKREHNLIDIQFYCCLDSLASVERVFFFSFRLSPPRLSLNLLTQQLFCFQFVLNLFSIDGFIFYFFYL